MSELQCPPCFMVELCSEDPSSSFGSRIIQVFPVILENSGFVMPERKLQSVFNHLAQTLCAEDASSLAFNAASACFQQVRAAASSHP